MTKARNSHFLFVIKLIFLQVNIKIPIKERTIDTAKAVFNREIFHDRNKMIRKILSTYLYLIISDSFIAIQIVIINIYELTLKRSSVYYISALLLV